MPVSADGHAHMKVKLLGISGSSRKAATDYAVNEALKYAAEKYDVETDYFSAHGKNLISAFTAITALGKNRAVCRKTICSSYMINSSGRTPS